jgi:hypothetical protein
MARSFLSSLETAERADGSSFIRLTDSPAPWASQAFYLLHAEELPNDARYSMARNLAEAFTYYETAEDAREHLREIADALSTASMAEILSFYQENLSRLSLPDDYREEFGLDPAADTSSLLHLGFWLAVHRAGESLLCSIEQAMEEAN